MAWEPGTPVRLRGSSLHGWVLNTTPSGMAEIRNSKVPGEVLHIPQDDLTLESSDALQLAQSIGASMFDPEETAALLGLLEACSPQEGPLRKIKEKLDSSRKIFELGVQASFFRLGGDQVFISDYRYFGYRGTTRLLDTRWVGANLEILEWDSRRVHDSVLFPFRSITHTDEVRVVNLILHHLGVPK